MKPGATGFIRIKDAARYSWLGLKAAWKNEAAFRQEVILLLGLGIVTLFLPVTALERLAMVGSLWWIVIVELLNSAIEAIVDRIGSEHHELSGRAKDMGSAAVLLSTIMAALVWIGVLWH
jgi:diacylglycerol kinase (ATP)